MARNKIHSVFSFLLLALLLFVQLGANLCHDDDCHRFTSYKETKGTHLEKKSEECSICHLQLSNHLFYQDFNTTSVDVRIEKSFLIQLVLETSLFSRDATGRAPPLV